MIKTGIIKRLKLHEVWKHEEQDFTPWLRDNIHVVYEATGLNISNPQNEQPTDNFYADIVGTLDDDSKVIIENQYGASNHDHLGKLLTYSAYFDARYAIWIVENARMEHIKAINRLNEYCVGENQSKVGYYLIEASAIQIDNSNPALILNVIAAPDPEPPNESLSARLIREFWAIFLKQCRAQHLDLYRNVNPRSDRWLDAGSGRFGIYYSIFVREDRIRVMLGMNKNVEWNLSAFNYFSAHQEEIEKTIGCELVWGFGKTDKASKLIAKELVIGGYKSDKSQWITIINEGVEMLRRFEKAFKPLIEEMGNIGV